MVIIVTISIKIMIIAVAIIAENVIQRRSDLKGVTGDQLSSKFSALYSVSVRYALTFWHRNLAFEF
jgi:hypothetical protein